MEFEKQDAEIDSLKSGGAKALAELFSMHQPRLQRLIKFRLDRRLWGRVDVSDVLQDAYIAASRRLPSYLKQPDVPFYVWLRQISLQVLTDLHRFHLGAKMRSAGVEIAMHHESLGHATSLSLASHLIDNVSSPSGAAEREESLLELRRALEAMDPIDREILALRHFEELGNNQIAQILGIQVTTASMRYIRALKRLREILSASPVNRDFRRMPGSQIPPLAPNVEPTVESLSDSSASGA
jgi:RNA polymerase sigma-70 factor (ECF subfamily)